MTELVSVAPIDPIGDAVSWVFANWLFLVAFFIIANVVVSFLKRAVKPAEEPVVRKRTAYVSTSAGTQSVEVEDTESSSENSNGDDSMAGKKLIEVWQCDQCEEYYDTKKEAKDDECTDKTITKFYQCDGCEEYFENPFRAQKDDECDGKFALGGESFHMIDGKLQFGHMKCLTAGCGWEGDIDDTESTPLPSTKAVTSDMGDLVYTTTEGEDGVLLHCPECGSESLVFVSKAKPAPAV
jgi:hypothetical protein